MSASIVQTNVEILSREISYPAVASMGLTKLLGGVDPKDLNKHTNI